MHSHRMISAFVFVLDSLFVGNLMPYYVTFGQFRKRLLILLSFAGEFESTRFINLLKLKVWK
ncbi:Uncharacterised protein [Bacteroides thetaiotaomicron]|nr:Uncharacterised protein [Bacteroides thetaiotaomicron]